MSSGIRRQKAHRTRSEVRRAIAAHCAVGALTVMASACACPQSIGRCVPVTKPPPTDLPGRDDPQVPRVGRAGIAVPSLAYYLPDRTEVEYRFSDSSHFTLRAADGRVLEGRTLTEATAELDLRPSSTGITARIRLTDFVSNIRTFTGDTSTTILEREPSPAEARVTRRGQVSLLRNDERLADRILSPTDLHGSFFTPLLGYPAEPGMSWVDTTIVDETTWRGRWVLEKTTTSVWERDVMIDGWVMNVIRSRSSMTMTFRGRLAGYDVQQSLQGEAEALTLWHPARRLVIEREESAALKGTTDVPELGIMGAETEAYRKKRVALRR